MSNNKQSSVEWFASEISIYLNFDQRLYLKEFLEQAKAMHKEEIEDAYWEGGQDVPVNGQQCQRYYNETFKDEQTN